MRYLLTNEILNAVLSASNGDSNYPVRNLQDRFLQKRFQSTGEISQITSLLDSIVACNCIAQGFTNATSIYSYLYGAGQGIFEAYTNLITFGTNLADASWTKANGATAVLSDKTVNGHRYTKIGSTTATSDPQVVKNVTVTNSVNVQQGIILSNGNHTNSVDDKTFLFVLAAGSISQVSITWVDKTVNLDIGDSIDYEWIDDNTVIIFVISNVTASTTATFRIDPISVADTDKYIYITECQLVDNTKIFFPYVDGSHTADVVDENFTLPDKLVIDLEFDPRFAFDISGADKYFFRWLVAPNFRLDLRYDDASDEFTLIWNETATFRFMTSQQFGSGFTNINQSIRFTIFLNLASGGINDSMLICTPLESGSQNIDNSWNGTPDVKVTVFPTLSIGWDGSTGLQADSLFSYLRVYGWNGTKPTITNNNDIDNYLADKTILFEWEPDDVIFNSSVVHNIEDDTDFTYFDSVDVKQIITTIEGPSGVYLGGLGAGEYLQLPDPLSDFERPLQDNSFVEQNPSGQVLANYGKPLIAPSFRFPPVLPTLANLIRNGYIDIGKGTPFYADFFENNRDFYSPLYCFFQSEPGDQKNSKRIEYAVDLMEAR